MHVGRGRGGGRFGLLVGGAAPKGASILLMLLTAGQFKCKIGLSFFTGQTWEFMGGYVQKDMGKPHYLFFAYPPIDEGALFVFLTHAQWIHSIIC